MSALFRTSTTVVQWGQRLGEGPDYAAPDYPAPDYSAPDYAGPDYAGPDYAGPLGFHPVVSAYLSVGHTKSIEECVKSVRGTQNTKGQGVDNVVLDHAHPAC